MTIFILFLNQITLALNNDSQIFGLTNPQTKKITPTQFSNGYLQIPNNGRLTTDMF